jgi:hypothetical protein
MAYPAPTLLQWRTAFATPPPRPPGADTPRLSYAASEAERLGLVPPRSSSAPATAPLLPLPPTPDPGHADDAATGATALGESDRWSGQTQRVHEADADADDDEDEDIDGVPIA